MQSNEHVSYLYAAYVGDEPCTLFKVTYRFILMLIVMTCIEHISRHIKFKSRKIYRKRKGRKEEEIVQERKCFLI